MRRRTRIDPTSDRGKELTAARAADPFAAGIRANCSVNCGRRTNRWPHRLDSWSLGLAQSGYA